MSMTTRNPTDPDEVDGKMRVNVISAADGTGVATVEIRNSSSPTGKYDGSADVTQEVHAGDTSVYLLFTYTPHETITDGELRVTVPTNWSLPQEDDQGEAGYTYFEEARNADIGAAVISWNLSHHLRRDYPHDQGGFKF